MQTGRPWVTLDGSQGEGGGQILRTALALSLLTGYGLRLVDIRGRREKKGLLRQHLAAVEAAAAIGQAQVVGNEYGSQELRFEPGPILHGQYHFQVGTAGSTSLVLQTILWPLMLVPGYSHIVLDGGTHNHRAPCFEYLERVFAPQVEALGGQIQIAMDKPGFYPAGGGRIQVGIRGGGALRRLELLRRGAVTARRARSLVSQLPIGIAQRELIVVQRHLDWPWSELEKVPIEANCPGNLLTLEVEHAGGKSMYTGFGEKGLPSETLAERTVKGMEEFLEADVPVDPWLADQLLLPMALAGGGAFRTVEPTLHTTTNAWVIQRFLAVEIAIRREGQLDHRVDVWRR